MSNLAPDLTAEAAATPKLTLVHSAASSKPHIFREIEPGVLATAFLLVILQVLDLLFTATGVLRHGMQAEGNLLIRSLMQSWGIFPALIFVKSVAFAVIGALCILSHRISWIERAMQLVAAIYIIAAVIPWGAIILFKDRL